MTPRSLVATLLQLWTLLAMLGAHAAPAHAYTPSLGREGVESTEVSPSGDRGAIAVVRASTQPVDARAEGRARRPLPHAPPLPAWPIAAAPSAPRLRAALAEVLPAKTWSAWETASCARARLMVFLN